MHTFSRRLLSSVNSRNARKVHTHAIRDQGKFLGKAIFGGIAAGSCLYFLSMNGSAEEIKAPPFDLPPLPYPKNALEPYISAETVDFHYGKHHQGYVTKLNALAQGNNLADKSLTEIVTTEKGKAFNLAAQIWNHTFYWESMKGKENKQDKPSEKLASAIEQSFGSFDKFREEFNNKAINHFGSGWAWLVQDKDSKKLLIVETHDADTPLVNPNFIPLLTCDVWEHAYYIDKRHDRAAYVNSWWNVVDWAKVEQRMK